MIETRERWLTLKEAAARLDEEYGVRTTWRSLEKLVHDKHRPMPSAKNFGKRQVRMSEIVPWLEEQGIIHR